MKNNALILLMLIMFTSACAPAKNPKQNTITDIPDPISDLRVITIDPEKLLCQSENLPIEGQYYIPPDGKKSSSNEEIINSRGIEDGKDYITATGRVIGWEVQWNINNKSLELPVVIYCSVAQFKTKAGATLGLSDYNNPTKHVNPNKPSTLVDKDAGIGDMSSLYVAYQLDSVGRKNTFYELFFNYYNMQGHVYAIGLTEKDISPDLLKQIARSMLARMKEEKLIDPNDAVFTK
jgi:hypothetical protein